MRATKFSLYAFHTQVSQFSWVWIPSLSELGPNSWLSSPIWATWVPWTTSNWRMSWRALSHHGWTERERTLYHHTTCYSLLQKAKPPWPSPRPQDCCRDPNKINLMRHFSFLEKGWDRYVTLISPNMKVLLKSILATEMCDSTLSSWHYLSALGWN